MYKEINMQKGIGTVAAIVIAAVVLAVGAGIYVSTKKDGLNVSEYKSNNGTSTDELSGNRSLRDLFSLGRDIRCTFRSEKDGVVNEGVVYATNRGERVRGDFTMTSTTSSAVQSSFIKEENTGYFWSSNMAQGVKMNLTTSASATSSVSTSNQQGFNLDENMDYKCENWNVDNGKFTVPANINFVDLGQSGQLKANFNVAPASGQY